jgi:hypothetical protein
MRCKRKRTTGREGIGRFGIRFWMIMALAKLIEYNSLTNFAIHQ